MNSRGMHTVKWCTAFLLALLLQGKGFAQTGKGGDAPVLPPEGFQHYFTEFASDEREMLGTAPPVPWDWFVANIPWLDIPDKEMERVYYFRWYAFQKHICKSEYGYLISEFLDDVPWSGKHNMIDAAAGHHIREARWLRNPAYVEDYTRFWFGPEGEPRRYSFWAADSVYQLLLATGNRPLAISLLPALEKNYEAWESTHKDANGLFWQIDDRDGMEDSISGNGYRPTINSYMYGDAVAISRLAAMAGQKQAAEKYQVKAEHLRKEIEGRLWNPNDNFYETVARQDSDGWSGDRELVGYVPWYFNIPQPQHDTAWKLLFDPQGFAGKFGPTTAERRNPRFGYKVRHECLWNGPSWPFATTQTLVALANLLNGPRQDVVNESDYFNLLSTYASSQHIETPNGHVIPWIDEDLNADTGEWVARNILITQHASPKNRGRYYNHSGFADLIISGLIGVRPESGNYFTVHPFIPAGLWDYFALDGLPYHGHVLTIMYDRDGTRYHRGAGLQVFCDGEPIAHAGKLQELRVELPVQSRPVKHVKPTSN
jgi:Mannosylglycerate hydrolase MGH1-like glycoside hydrolase domain/Glycosyl hydrolase family 65, C-terminal domain